MHHWVSSAVAEKGTATSFDPPALDARWTTRAMYIRLSVCLITRYPGCRMSPADVTDHRSTRSMKPRDMKRCADTKQFLRSARTLPSGPLLPARRWWMDAEIFDLGRTDRRFVGYCMERDRGKQTAKSGISRTLSDEAS
jgi:hypothetical protein